MIKDVSKSLLFLKKKEKKKLINLSLTKFLTGVMDLVGVASIIPFLAVITNEKIMNNNEYILNIKNSFNVNNNEVIIILAISSFILLILNYLIRWFDIWYDSYVGNNIWLNLSKRLFSRYLLEPYSFHLINSTNSY